MNHEDKVKESKRKWREKNKDKIREYQRQYRLSKKKSKVEKEIVEKEVIVKKIDHTLKETENPLRQCKQCGDIGNAYAIKRPNGNIIYTSKCKKCLNNNARSKLYSVCQKCSADKEESYQRYCVDCINEVRWLIKPEELLTIKKWCRKQELRNWMTDLLGLSELITIYQLVTNKESEYDNMSSGNQLQKMWNKVLSVYNEIKDIKDETLLQIHLDKTTLKLKKKENMLKKLENSDLDFFFNLIQQFEYEDKIYSFQEEYLSCMSGESKVSCVRCRKIIQELRRELVRLRNKTKNEKK